MTDTHATDLLALVTELSELEYKRGLLRARLEWHLRLHDVAATSTPVRPGESEGRPVVAKRARGSLMRDLLAHVAAHPGASCAQIGEALGTSADSVRQAATILVTRKQLMKQGSHYVIRESHSGSGLVVAQG